MQLSSLSRRQISSLPNAAPHKRPRLQRRAIVPRAGADAGREAGGRSSAPSPAPMEASRAAEHSAPTGQAPLPGLPGGARVIEDQAVLQVETLQLQDRRTRKLQLANGLQVLMVSDPGTKSAAAAMTVRAGSWQDLAEPCPHPGESGVDAQGGPCRRQGHAGTAHFLEHMLFMGTREFPDEAEYQQYLGQHGGYSNAYTAADHTCYLFSCDNAALQGALQRFAGFFTDPMLKSSCIERESMAVDSEYRGDIDHEGWRAMHVQATQNNPQHPASRFTIGSVDTLRGLDSAALRKWYDAHYSANLMHLVVYSPQPLDALQAQVVANFSQVPNHNLKSQRLAMPLFDPTKLGTLVFAETERKGQSTLSMRWELPYDLATDHAGWPAALVSHALGQEGTDSLLFVLKERGLATGLGTGEQHELPGSAVMKLQVSLTDKGVAQIHEVAQLCYAAIGQVRRHGVSRAVFDDLAAAGKRDYAFQTRRDAYKTVQAHARGLLEMPLASYQDALVAPTEYKPEAIAAVVNAMTPQACQFMLVAHPDTAKRRGTQKEAWMQVPYSVEKLPADQLAAWAQAAPPSEGFALPRANPFMPKQLAVQPLSANSPTERAPRRLVDDAHMTVFTACDVHERTPRVSWTFDILTPDLKEPSAQAQVLRDLYLRGVNDALTEVMAEAQVAGMGAGVGATQGGVRVSLAGYSDRATVLLEAVLSKLQGCMPSRQRFADMLEEMRHAYADARLGSPIGQAMEQLDAVRRSHFVSREACEAVLEKVTYEDVQAFGQQLLGTNHVQASLMGSQREEQLQAVLAQLRRYVSGKAYAVAQAPKTRVRALPNRPVCLEKDAFCKDSGVLMTLEHGKRDLTNTLEQDLLLRVLHERFFDELRTKQQTAYQVGAMGRSVGDQLYTHFLVQPNRHDVRDVLARIEQFVEAFRSDVGHKVLGEGDFNDLKAALLTELREPPHTMQEACGQMHTFAFQFDGEFDRVPKRIAALEALTYGQFKAWVLDALGPDNRHRLAVLIHGTRAPEGAVVYTSAQDTAHAVKMAI